MCKYKAMAFTPTELDRRGGSQRGNRNTYKIHVRGVSIEKLLFTGLFKK
jgi:hypothetical protein